MGKLSELSKARRKWIVKKRRELGLCRSCGAEANCNSLCDCCRTNENKRQQRMRLERKKLNLCTNCEKPLEDGFKYLCNECNIKKYGLRVCKECGKDISMLARKLLYCHECSKFIKCKKRFSCIYIRKCKLCDKLFTTKEANKRFCSRSCQSKASYYRNNNIIKKVITCCECGKKFNTYNYRRKYCCEICAKRATSRNNKLVRRTRERNGDMEVVNINVLFNRDNGKCQICNRKLNMKRSVPHPLAATIDHIKPLSNGGQHNYKNVQLLCFKCNSLKGNSKVNKGEQYRLYIGGY